MFTYVTFLYYKSTHTCMRMYTHNTHTHTRSIFKGPSLSSYERPKAAHGGVHGPPPRGSTPPSLSEHRAVPTRRPGGWKGAVGAERGLIPHVSDRGVWLRHTFRSSGSSKAVFFT